VKRRSAFVIPMLAAVLFVAGVARGTEPAMPKVDPQKLPEGAKVPAYELVYESEVTISPPEDFGDTIEGHRRVIPITGGTFRGPAIRGKVLAGGADWQLQRADDYTLLEADYMIEAEDGTPIHVRNRGLTNSRVKGATARYLRTVPEFEAPAGPHEWLNQSVFVGSLQGLSSGPPAVMVHVFRLV